MNSRIYSAFFVMLFVSLLSACTRPLLIEDKGPSAKVDLANDSVGYSQFMTFGDSQKCADPQLIGYGLKSGESRAHSLPAEKIITISVGAVGLPADPGNVAWCPPIFISTKLVVANHYRIRFSARSAEKICSVSIFNLDSNKFIHIIKRIGTGSPIGSGVLSDPISCEPNQVLENL